jgi:hypothetical protein
MAFVRSRLSVATPPEKPTDAHAHAHTHTHTHTHTRARALKKIISDRHRRRRRRPCTSPNICYALVRGAATAIGSDHGYAAVGQRSGPTGGRSWLRDDIGGNGYTAVGASELAKQPSGEKPPPHGRIGPTGVGGYGALCLGGLLFAGATLAATGAPEGCFARGAASPRRAASLTRWPAPHRHLRVRRHRHRHRLP